MDVERREEAHRVDLLEKELILVRKELGHVANEDNIGKEVKKKAFLRLQRWFVASHALLTVDCRFWGRRWPGSNVIAQIEFFEAAGNLNSPGKTVLVADPSPVYEEPLFGRTYCESSASCTQAAKVPRIDIRYPSGRAPEPESDDAADPTEDKEEEFCGTVKERMERMSSRRKAVTFSVTRLNRFMN